MFGSMTEPKMTLASSPAALVTTLAASLTSNSVRSRPPVMLTSTPSAPAIETSSSNGLETAACAASIARFAPEARPVPIRALPRLDMTALTSAKSRLTSPGTVTRSEMPLVALSSTSSATAKASVSEVPLSTTASSRSFGMMIRVSTSARSSASPSSAWRMRRRPSKLNGLVTTATVSAPVWRARRATTGAPPVPVPPPIPAVMNTMSLSVRASMSVCSSSSAARRPWAGSPPEPRPRVAALPIWMRVGASD